MELKKGNTTYKVEKENGWVYFSREVYNKAENCTSIKENISIDVQQEVIYCNRTGDIKTGVRGFLRLIERINKIFDTDVLADECYEIEESGFINIAQQHTLSKVGYAISTDDAIEQCNSLFGFTMDDFLRLKADEHKRILKKVTSDHIVWSNGIKIHRGGYIDYLKYNDFIFVRIFGDIIIYYICNNDNTNK